MQEGRSQRARAQAKLLAEGGTETVVKRQFKVRVNSIPNAIELPSWTTVAGQGTFPKLPHGSGFFDQKHYYEDLHVYTISDSRVCCTEVTL